MCHHHQCQSSVHAEERKAPARSVGKKWGGHRGTVINQMSLWKNSPWKQSHPEQSPVWSNLELCKPMSLEPTEAGLTLWKPFCLSYALKQQLNCSLRKTINLACWKDIVPQPSLWRAITVDLHIVERTIAFGKSIKQTIKSLTLVNLAGKPHFKSHYIQ